MKKILLVAALAILPTVAFGQAFPSYPTVGVPDQTQCLQFGNNNVCNQYRPAGPNNLAPGSTIPADTNLAGGQNPQTVRVPAEVIGASSADAAPLTGTTITYAAAPAPSKLMLFPAGTIAALTVVLPPATNLYDGQLFSIYTSQTVTALTVTAGTGTTLTPTITTVTAAAPIKLIYNKQALAWQLF